MNALLILIGIFIVLLVLLGAECVNNSETKWLNKLRSNG